MLAFFSSEILRHTHYKNRSIFESDTLTKQSGDRSCELTQYTRATTFTHLQNVAQLQYFTILYEVDVCFLSYDPQLQKAEVAGKTSDVVLYISLVKEIEVNQSNRMFLPVCFDEAWRRRQTRVLGGGLSLLFQRDNVFIDVNYKRNEVCCSRSQSQRLLDLSCC